MNVFVFNVMFVEKVSCQKGGMVGHVNSVHGCWRFLCDVCGEGFLSRDDMIVLVNSVHDWYLKSSFNSVHVI